jgi:hypothetical protein
MKKVLIIIICFLAIQIKAQVINEQQYSKLGFSLRAGGSLLPDFDNQFQNNYKLGLTGGLAGTYKFNKYLGLKLEASISQRGISYSYSEKDNLFSSFNSLIGMIIDTSLIGSIQGYIDDGVYSDYNGYHKLTYVESPLLAEFSIKKFTLTAGPYFGYLIKSYTKESLDQNIPLLDIVSPVIDSLGFAATFVKALINSTFPGYESTVLTESTASSKFTKLNYGFLVQLSYEIYNHTYLEARYSRNLNYYLIDDKSSSQLSNFTLSFIYNFKFKKANK